jgi:hypothetical protein
MRSGGVTFWIGGANYAAKWTQAKTLFEKHSLSRATGQRSACDLRSPKLNGNKSHKLRDARDYL